LPFLHLSPKKKKKKNLKEVKYKLFFVSKVFLPQVVKLEVNSLKAMGKQQKQRNSEVGSLIVAFVLLS
jgi:hypothetical protein